MAVYTAEQPAVASNAFTFIPSMLLMIYLRVSVERARISSDFTPF